MRDRAFALYRYVPCRYDSCVVFEAERITGSHFEPNLLIEFLRPPFRRFEILTPMSPAHATRVLQENVEPSKTFRWTYSKNHRYFEGTVDRVGFAVSRIIGYRNSFVPIIEGSFRSDGPQTIATLNMRMAWPVMVFWFGMMMLMIWLFVVGDSHFMRFHGTQTFLIKMILFMYLLASVCFAIEVRIAMKRLMSLLSSRDGS
jgi:hypothetical protein